MSMAGGSPRAADRKESFSGAIVRAWSEVYRMTPRQIMENARKIVLRLRSETQYRDVDEVDRSLIAMVRPGRDIPARLPLVEWDDPSPRPPVPYYQKFEGDVVLIVARGRVRDDPEPA